MQYHHIILNTQAKTLEKASTRLRFRFFRFQKKIASTRSVYESFLTVHTNTQCRFKNAKKSFLAVDERVVSTALILKEVVQADR